MEVSGVGGALQVATGAEVVDVGPRLGDSVRSLLQDLVVRGAGTLVSAAPGDEASTPRSSSTVSAGVSGLYLPGSPSARPRLSTRGGCICRSPPQRGCCMRH
jgi:hypothetical protein